MTRRLIAGNWKMNGLKGAGGDLARDLAARARSSAPDCDFLVCPPAPLRPFIFQLPAISLRVMAALPIETAVS